MTASELHKAFKMTIDKEDIVTVPSFTPIEIDHWLNTAQDRLVNTKFAGSNPRRIGIDQDQKRIDDLSMLYMMSQEEVFPIGGERGYYIHIMTLPEDYMHLISTEVAMTIGDNAMLVQPIECTPENVTSKLNNSLSEHRLHNGKARPLQLINNGLIEFYTDTNYSIEYVIMRYIKKPNRVLNTSNNPIGNFPDYMWSEVVSLAARLALANTSDGRYSAYAQESQLAE